MESILRVGNVAGSTSIHEDWDRLRCAFEVDGEQIAEEMLCLAHIVIEFSYHARRLDER